MPVQYDINPTRRIGFDFTIDDEIRQEQEMLRLREGKADISSPLVSARARDAWQERRWRNLQRVRHYRLRNQDEFINVRGGRSYHMIQFVRKLNTLPRRKFTLNWWALKDFRGLNVSRGGGPPEYVCALQDGINKEWSLITLDDHGLRKRYQNRGWRDVLSILIDKGFVSERESHRLFGFPSGQSGRVFRQQRWEFRNRKLYDGQENAEFNRLQAKESFL